MHISSSLRLVTLYSFTHLTQLLTHLLTHPFIHSSIHSLSSLTCTLSNTHSLIHQSNSFTHTHLFTVEKKFITRSLDTSENLIGQVEPQAHIQEKGNRTFLPTASCGAHDRIHCRSYRRVWRALWSVACNRAHLGEQHSYQAWREREMNENCGKVSVSEWIGLVDERVCVWECACERWEWVNGWMDEWVSE